MAVGVPGKSQSASDPQSDSTSSLCLQPSFWDPSPRLSGRYPQRSVSQSDLTTSATERAREREAPSV